MADERRGDAVDTFLRTAPTWEPPDGFALRVIAAARSDERRDAHVPRPLAVIGITGRFRAHLAALSAKRASAAWVLRQYWNLLRGQ